jgi:ClpP class serine protease
MSIENQPRALSHVRAAIYGQPWAIREEWLASIAEIAERHVAGDKAPEYIAPVMRGRRCPDCKDGRMSQLMRDGYMGRVPSGRSKCAECEFECMDDELPPYDLIRGVAIIPLEGPLFPRANMMTRYSGATSYQEFSQWLGQAVADDDCETILIHGYSPGGACAGMAECAAKVFAARSTDKAVIGLCDPMVASAAYAVMSQCEELYTTESAMVGSIGVLMRMNNYDRAERNEGNDPVVIRSSELKAMDQQPQSVNQYGALLRNVNAYFQQFKDIVSRGRPGTNVNAVATGETWIGKDSVSNGICDGVSTLDELIAEFGK